MIDSKIFFEHINFNFKNELKPIDFTFEKNIALYQKTVGKIFRYTPLNDKTQCVFTLIDALDLNDDDLFEIRKYIWNENKSDLLFVHNQNKLDLYYSFTDPLKSPVLIDSFAGNEDDKILLEKIAKSNFDTGYFWEVYQSIQHEIKSKRLTVDKGLVRTLQLLRRKLQDIYLKFIVEENKREEIVQALIDRTLFIKFLEDKHIINSFFYGHYFKEGDTYIQLLKSHRKDDINELFSIINHIFNNSLFENPHIPTEHLFDNALSLIADALEKKNFDNGQLSLFGYRFDVIPLEFIGHVYEMFFEDKQSKEGIFYTPEGLAKLIVDETIGKTGKILDPSCGSGMFLVIGVRKLFANEGLLSNVTIDDIAKRNKILLDYIYGIEKQENARRLTILSLYLELLNGIKPEELKNFIKASIESGEDFKIFPFDFTSNIIQGNALNVSFINGINDFEYIIGNPPFSQIKEGEEEGLFCIDHKDIVSNKQLSQCFFVKIQDWCNSGTKLGFVSNLSNFNSDSSIKFQKFFYDRFEILKFYNLSEVKDILFENAKESVAVIIFNSKKGQNNELKFLTPKLTNFSKLFKIVLLRENDLIKINQSELINNDKSLKDFFVGDEQDLKLANKIYSQCDPLSNFLVENPKGKTGYAINNGIQLLGSGNQPKEWGSYNSIQKKKYKMNLVAQNAQQEESKEYSVPYLECSNIEPFQILGKYQFYKSNIETLKKILERVRTNDDYIGERILFPRIGTRLRAAFVNYSAYYCFDIYSIQLKESKLYPLFTAILNSDVVNYYLMIKHRKRVSDSFPKVTMNDILKLPIPIMYDNELLSKISTISERLIGGVSSFITYKNELNNLIFDLYGLSRYEKQKVIDFYLKSSKVTIEKIDEYISCFIDIIKPYIDERIIINGYKYIDNKLASSFIGVKIEFTSRGGNQNIISTKQVVDYSLIQLVKEIGNTNIYTTKDKIYGENCLFFIRENDIKNWSKSKAFEDAKNFLIKLSK